MTTPTGDDITVLYHGPLGMPTKYSLHWEQDGEHCHVWAWEAGHLAETMYRNDPDDRRKPTKRASIFAKSRARLCETLKAVPAARYEAAVREYEQREALNVERAREEDVASLRRRAAKLGFTLVPAAQ